MEDPQAQDVEADQRRDEVAGVRVEPEGEQHQAQSRDPRLPELPPEDRHRLGDPEDHQEQGPKDRITDEGDTLHPLEGGECWDADEGDEQADGRDPRCREEDEGDEQLVDPVGGDENGGRARSRAYMLG